MKKTKVLVVDDSSFFRTAIQTFLETRSEIELVGLCESGEDCLERISELSPDVVIMDVSMPGIDGAQVSRRLKKTHPKTKIIICTIFVEKEAQDFARRASADDYFVKGQPLADLLEKILDVAHS